MDKSLTPITTKKFSDDRKVSDPPKKPPRGGWGAAIFIISVEIAEVFAFIGISSNLIMYLTTVFHEPTAVAAKHVNMWVGVSAIFPLIGAFVADSCLGRFKTIILSSFIYLVGTVILTLSVTVIGENHRKVVFFLALYILSIGEGGHRPCVQTFAADQFDEDSPEERKKKSSFFNWWYLGLVIGSTLAVFVVIYVQDNISWALSFGVLGGVVAVAIAVFLIGVKRYRRQIPLGSPMTKIAQVMVAAARKWRVDDTRFGWRLCYDGDGEGQNYLIRNLGRTDQFRILDKAAMIDDEDEGSKTRNPWRLCTVTEVEEVKLILRLIPIWLSCLMFTVIQAQLHTYFTKQGSTMLRSVGPHFQFPPASLQGVVGLTIFITIAFYDRIFVPAARKFTGHHSGITVLQRIGIGLFFSILNMVVSALVEAKRIRVSAQHNLIDSPKEVVPITIWWLIPQYMLCGVSDAFTIVGLQELFYDQMPVTMRSFGAAAYISIVGVGNFISSALISVVQAITSTRGPEWLDDNLNRAHLDYFYWVLAVLSALNLCVYVWIAKGFVYKRVELDDHQVVSNQGGVGKEQSLKDNNGCYGDDMI